MAKKYAWTGFFGLLGGIVIATLFIFYAYIQEELTKQELRGECIAHYVSLGIERRDIETEGRYCWVVEE